MIRSFKSRGTEDIFEGFDSKAARSTLPRHLHAKAGALLDRLNAATGPHSLTLPGLKVEKLRGDRSGQYSIRINSQYQICFRWSRAGAEEVEIANYH